MIAEFRHCHRCESSNIVKNGKTVLALKRTNARIKEYMLNLHFKLFAYHYNPSAIR